MPPKKWRIVYPGAPETDEFRSLVKTYEFVDALRRTYQASLRPPSALYEPVPNPNIKLTVQVDEGLGAGWELYEHIDFAAETTGG